MPINSAAPPQMRKMMPLEACRAIPQEAAQRELRARKGDVRPGDIGGIDQRDLQTLGPCAEMAVAEGAAKKTPGPGAASEIWPHPEGGRIFSRGGRLSSWGTFSGGGPFLVGGAPLSFPQKKPRGGIFSIKIPGGGGVF